MTNGLYGRCIHDLNPAECEWCKQNQKLRELIEKRQEKWKKASYMTEEEQYTFDELQTLLKDSKN